MIAGALKQATTGSKGTSFMRLFPVLLLVAGMIVAIASDPTKASSFGEAF